MIEILKEQNLNPNDIEEELMIYPLSAIYLEGDSSTPTIYEIGNLNVEIETDKPKRLLRKKVQDILSIKKVGQQFKGVLVIDHKKYNFSV